MSDIYVARQPIFSKAMKLFGYELLYRKTQNNFYEGTDDDISTASLIDDLFFMDFTELTDGRHGFINFSRKLLIDEIPLLLPKDKLIIEILERVEIDEEVLEICRSLKSQGYTLAIDDFIFNNTNKLYDDLIDIVDIIKVEYYQDTIADQISLINKYRSKITFLAERVETREDYEIAQKMGYVLFQGYFFSKPVMMNAKTIGTLSNNLISIMNDLNASEPDFEAISLKFETDIELSYKLLKLVNSVFYGVAYQIKSIHHALVQLGAKELSKWINIMMLKEVQNIENKELIKLSLIRGKMLSLLSIKLKLKAKESDYFIVGIFSSIDVLLNQEMDKILSNLPLKQEVKDALLGESNVLNIALKAIINFENSVSEKVDNYLQTIGVKRQDFMQIYVEALKWRKSLAL